MDQYQMNKVYVKPGQRVRVILPLSEVCMHMKVAGKQAEIELYQWRPSMDTRDISLFSAQIYINGEPYSSRVTTGEAGFYFDEQKGQYYAYEIPVDMGDVLPSKTCLQNLPWGKFIRLHVMDDKKCVVWEYQDYTGCRTKGAFTISDGEYIGEVH